MINYRTNFKKYFLLEINPVVRFMILSDFVWMGALGLLSPIFAIFIEGSISGGNAAVAGTAASIFLITKSIIQIPVAVSMDKMKNEFYDFWIMFISSLLTALLPISYLYIHTPGELYITQLVYGLLTAFTFPSFMGIFTRHIDKHKEDTDWGVYYTVTDLSSAFAAFVGGVVVTMYGFDKLIIAIVILSVVGVLFLLPVHAIVKKKRALAMAMAKIEQ